MRVVLDTNVVLSALLFTRGRLSTIRELWMERKFLPLVNRETSEELIRTLAYPKFKLDEEEIEVLLGSYLPYTDVVTMNPKAPKGLPQCRDPKDQIFIILAARGKAEVLVSGDDALRELSGKTEFEIEAPAQFLKRFPG